MKEKLVKVLEVKFFATLNGTEPVREWLFELSIADRKIIGQDILTVQYEWPIGKPLVDNLGKGLWEVRIKLDNRIARIIFIIDKKLMVLLHGFIKKSQKTPKIDLELANKRVKEYARWYKENK